MTKLKIIALIAVIVVTAVALAPSLNNGFTNWDDPDFITENPDIKSISFKKIGKFFTTSYGGFAGYVPFILLTYTVEYSLFGLNAQAYHTTNLVLHLINCVLVFWFIFLISQKLPVAFIVSLLFGIHPLHVEPVAWIQGRKDLLFSLFYLAALILYVKYLKKGRKKSFYFFALLFFILSLFSKVAAISLPFSLLLLDFFISKKIDKQSIQNKIPFFLFSLLFVFLAFLTFDTGAFAIQASDIDYVNNILLFFYSFIFYINKILLPFQLSARYSMDISQLPLNLLAGVGIFFVIIFLLYRFYRSERYRHDVTFGILFF